MKWITYSLITIPNSNWKLKILIDYFSRSSFWQPKFGLYDAAGDSILKIQGPFCCWDRPCFPCDTEFMVYIISHHRLDLYLVIVFLNSNYRLWLVTKQSRLVQYIKFMVDFVKNSLWQIGLLLTVIKEIFSVFCI